MWRFGGVQLEQAKRPILAGNPCEILRPSMGAGNGAAGEGRANFEACGAAEIERDSRGIAQIFENLVGRK